MRPDDRNPWTGISAWREFRYDLRHPGAFFRRGLAGARGQNPAVSDEMRWLGLACCAAGALQFLAGLLFIVASLTGA